ncbi:hypothetical protein ASG63_20055 [Methylobacterium sp. Leaf94]|nr:hypothetical protein ASG63_20055 [Methylobacterium sp. Leaf94]
MAWDGRSAVAGDLVVLHGLGRGHADSVPHSLVSTISPSSASASSMRPLIAGQVTALGLGTCIWKTFASRWIGSSVWRRWIAKRCFSSGCVLFAFILRGAFVIRCSAS